MIMSKKIARIFVSIEVRKYEPDYRNKHFRRSFSFKVSNPRGSKILKLYRLREKRGEETGFFDKTLAV
jgi:hypothetical protein